MRIICDGLDLSDAVATVLKATASKTINPILEGIKLKAYEDTLELTATNLELSIIKKIRAEVFEEGEIIVPGNFFSNYIKKLTSEQIELKLISDSLLKIIYTDSVGEVQCLKTAEFPNIKQIVDSEYIEIIENDLKDLINKVIFSVAIDDSRPILKGVLLEVQNNTLNGVALDGYRLAYCQKPISESTFKSSIIVPSYSLQEISKILNTSDNKIKLQIEKNILYINLEGVQITTRLLDGEFINYKQIIPKEFATKVTISRNQFENTLERASLLAKLDKNNLVVFDIKENNLLITSNSEIGNIKENLNTSLQGQDIKIAFNTRYFTDILRTLTDEYIVLNLNTPYSPCIISPSQSDKIIYLVLPVRIIN